ncbi:PucR family transcriptional regulator [Saccharopolyspora elongata]|uniref:PucR family transcriptional regulator n=1 Tax=Saccharopolyspora elongata TaxID=2530387 RepID=A0A4R4XRQ6_9PSEU|nr:PucR family transcriptional regulator [Saccharopolyspora elongata]TDD34111.1 PucR family transcriptional regulator [Saccharopolyspora elongata]
MQVPLRWLVGRPELGLRVRAGADQLDRAFSWVHAIDLADPSPWLAGSELVLTTGLGLPAQQSAQRNYVRGVAEAGSAALGFGVGLSYQDIPDAVVGAAEELRLPLVEVPLSTPFRDVIRVVVDRYAEERHGDLLRNSRVQSSMTRAAVRQGPESVVHELAIALEAQVLLRSSDGSVLAASSADAEELSFSLPEGDLDSTMTFTAMDKNGTTIAQPVWVGGRRHGWLVLARPSSLRPADHTLISQAVSLIVLDRVKPRGLRAAQNRLNRTIFGLGLGRSVSPWRFEEHLRDVGLTGTELRVLACGGADPGLMLDEADDLLDGEELPTIAVERDEHLVVLLPGTGLDLAKTLTAALVRRSRSAYGGLSEPVTPEHVPGALHQALTAARTARARRAPLVCFGELAGHALVFDSRTREALAELARERLGRLSAFDRENGTALVTSLRAYLEHGGQWNVASTVLGVHRHTLRGRMEQIRDLLGIDIDSAHVRAELLLSLMVWTDDGETDMTEFCSAEAGHDVQ